MKASTISSRSGSPLSSFLRKNQSALQVLTGLMFLATCLSAQTSVNMSNGSSTGCSFNFYDSGGTGGSYGNNENLVHTFNPASANDRMRLTFASIYLDYSDKLTVYDGTSTADPVLFGPATTYSYIPVLVSTTGSLTIKFTSNSNYNSGGWSATVDCVTCSGAPAASTTTLISPATCAGYPFTLGLGTTYNETYFYQWEDAATAGGTYANIAGATQSTLTATLPSTTARSYRCKITCSLSGQTTTSAVRTVTPAGSTISLNCPQNITVCANPVNYAAVTGTATNSACVPSGFPGYTFLGIYNGHHYFLSDAAAGSWADARFAAIQLGGYLASVTTSGENSFLATALTQVGSAGFWLGGTDATTEGTWVWESGEAFSYTNWAAGEPNSANSSEDYIEMYADGMWNDNYYFNDLKYVVEIPATLPASIAPTLTAGLPSGSNFPTGTTTVTHTYAASSCSFTVTLNQPAPTIACPPNITTCINPVSYPTPVVSVPSNPCLPTSLPKHTFIGAYGGHHYFIPNNSPSYASLTTAQNVAAGLGCHLAAITSAGENDFLKNALPLANTQFWIGLNDVATEGVFVWDTGETFSYSNWDTGEPNNAGSGSNEDYVFLLRSNGKWNDLATTYIYGGYILEVAPSDNVIEHPAPTLVSGPTSGSIFPVGTPTTVTYTYGGASCSFTVTVDDPDPVVVCPPDLTTCTSPVNYATPVAYVPSATCLPTKLTGFNFIGTLGSHHYFVSTSSKYWTDADNIAANMGAHLVSIGSAAENDLARSAALNLQADCLIGITDAATEGSYIWSSGETVSYTNWDTGEPSNTNNEDYGILRWKNGKWSDVNSTYGYGYFIIELEAGDFKDFVTPVQLGGPASGAAFSAGTTSVSYGYGGSTCSFNVTVANPTPTVACPANITTCTNPVYYVTPTATVPSTNCLPTKITNYTFIGAHGGHHYFTYNLQSNYKTAIANAIALGGQLASIGDAAENEFLRAALYSAGKEFYIGINDTLTENSFAWTNGDPVSYTNWAPGEPNNSGDEDAGTLTAYRGRWNDVPVSTSLGYIVEFSPGASYTETVTLTRTVGLPSGSDFPNGATTVTHTYNSSTCTFTVTKNTPTATLSCPPNITVCSNPVYYQIPTGTTDCANCTLPATQTSMTFLGSYGGHNYFIATSSSTATLLSWANARTDAALRGGHLASITSSGENAFLQTAVSAITTSGVWIGLNDEGVEGAFAWEFGDAFSYANWTSGEPNNSGSGEDFVTFSPSTGTWNDATASTTGRYILEMECNQRITPTLTAGLPSGGNFPTGTTTVTYSYGSSNCSFTVTRTEPAPTATHCPANFTVCANPVYYAAPTAELACASCALPTSFPDFTYLGTYGGHAYFRSNNKDRWVNAEAIAAGLGGHLASITSVEENDFVKTAVAFVNSSHWIGINDVATEGTFVWSDGDAVSYTNWASGEPNDSGGNEDGGAMSTDGTWNDLAANSSSNQLYFIVEIECPATSLMNLTSGFASGGNFPTGTTAVMYSYGGSSCSFTVTREDATATLQCPSSITTCLPQVHYSTPVVSTSCADCNLPTSLAGFTYLGTYQGHAYFRSNTMMYWSWAKSLAAQLGGHLVTVNDRDENDFLRALINPLTFNHLIGLTDETAEGTYVWESGETSTFRKWNTGEPSNSLNEDYAEMVAASGKWNDTRGNMTRYFLIEFDGCDVEAVPSLTAGLASGSTFPNGSNTVTWSYNGSSCSFNVNVEPADSPDPVTATPGTVGCGENAQLNGTTASGGYVRWFTQSTGGTSVGVSESGQNFSVSPSATTTYYAETADSTSSGVGLPLVTDTFNYTGGLQYWTAPAWVDSITVDAWGAGGGSAGKSGGYGGRVQTTLPVIPGATYSFVVGGRGQIGVLRMGGGGGGWTGIMSDDGTHLVVAGGGGGSSANATVCALYSVPGGNGGGPNGGQDGPSGNCGTGGTGGAVVTEPTVGAGGTGNAAVSGLAGTATGGGKGGFDAGTYGRPACGGGGSYGLAGATTSFLPNGTLNLASGGAGGFGGGGGGGGTNYTSSQISIRSNGGGGGGGYSGGQGGGNDYECTVCGASGGGGGGSYVIPEGDGTAHTQGGGADSDEDGSLFITYQSEPESCPIPARTPVTVTFTSTAISQQPVSTTVCSGSNAQFSLTANATTFQWQEKIGAGAFTNITNGGIYGGATTATLTLTGVTTTHSGRQYRCNVSGGTCGDATSDAAILTVNAAPTIANAGSDQTGAATCGSTQVTLAANSPTVGTGAWTIVSGTGGSFGNASSPTSTFSGTVGTAYVLRWTISNSPCTASQDNVNVTFNISPTTANAGADRTDATTCGLTQVTLAGNAPSVGTGVWTKISGTGGSFGNASSPTSTFSGTAGTAYVLRWTISNAPCTASTDDVNVTFNQNPTTAAAGADQTGASTCGLTQVTLAANSPTVGTGAWSIVSGTGGSFGNASSPTSTFSGTAGTAYVLRWTISNSPCTPSTDDVNVTFNQNPTVTCPANFTVEDDDPAFALTGATPTGGTYSGTGVSGGMFDPAVAGIGTHTINYMYTSAAGCSGSCTFTITVVSGCPATGTVWFVNPAAAGGGNGASWDCAFQNLQDAIDAASSGHEVWVKAGTHVPTEDPFGSASPSDPRDKTFYLKNGVKIYGGFAGTENTLSQRNWTSNVTILSGEIGAAGNSDNCYHVVVSVSDANTTVLDGFTISGGNANGTDGLTVEGKSVFRHSGGGMHNNSSSPGITNCLFTGNVAGGSGAGYGGGMLNFSTSSPSLTNCTFSGNSASLGAGVYNSTPSSPAMNGCIFSGNSAAFFGGGMLNYSATPTLTNCLFSGNSAGASGGGMSSNFNSAPVLMNCTFSGNKSGSGGGGMENISSTPTLTNCIVWNNRVGSTTGSANANIYNNSSTPVITYSLIQNVTDGTNNNLNGSTYGSNTNYPDFVTPLDPATAPSTAGDFHITACSPVVNIGSTVGAPIVDLFGNARPFGEAVDFGVHELQTAQTAPVAICQNASVNLDGAGSATLAASAVNNNSTGCLPLTLAVSPSTFNCSQWGTPQTVTLTVTGINNFSATCTATVTVNDNLPPNALCRDFVKNLGAGGTATITPAEVDNLSTDNCGTVNLVSVSPNSFTCSNIGSNTVTLTVNDGHGNTSTCTGNVTIADATAPTAMCQNVSAVLTAAGTASITASQVNNGSTDNCGIASMSVSPSSFTCANVGNQTVTLTVTDNSNLTNTCTATVAVTDATAPTATCQNITVNLGTNGTVNITGSDVNNGSSDNCGIASLSVSPSSFSCANVGAQSVTLTVTDNSNLTSTCSATVTVSDATAPAAVCQNITVNLDGSGNASITGGQIDGGSTDNCGIASLGASPNTFTISNLGANNVTLTVTDDNSLTATCIAVVTVTNTNAPNAVCQPHTAVLGSNGSVTILPANVDGGSTAVGGIASMSVAPNTLTCSNLGTSQVTLTVVGNNGQQATCNAAVTVQDNTDPTPVCQNVTAVLTAAGTASITPAQVLNAALSSDNCGTVNAASVTPNSFNCNNLGANTVTLTANDGNGNDATCTATVTVNDDTDPAPACQNVPAALAADGTASITASQVYNSGASSDNCGTINLVGVAPNSFTCSNLGANTVTLTVNDGHGNEATCTATVTVSDNLAPNALCRDIVVQLDGSGNASITASQIDNGSSDNCALGTLTVNPNAFTLSNLGINTVTLTVPDANSNSASCTAQVTVENNQLPNAVCQNIARNLSAGGTVSLTPDDVDGGSTALGGIASRTVSPTSLNCSNLGANTVTLTVVGNNGQQASCNATVTVSDNLAPTATCQNVPAALAADGTASITASQVNNASTDNCGTVNLVSVSPNSFTCSNLGTNTVTLTINDGNGNTSTCTATVTVSDATAPTATCQNVSVSLVNGVASVTPAEINNGSTDNCGTVNLVSVVPNSFTCSNLGANTVTLTINDGNGNPSTCTATVTVSGSGMATWFDDDDNDGFGDANDSQMACVQPSGYVSNDDDCNDANGNVNPSATEACNTIDDDCDTQIDEGNVCDGDGDGVTIAQGDCNDGNPNIYPTAPEACNGLDDDCDTQIDEGALLNFYADGDMDGFGNASVSQQACVAPSGFVSNNDDCNDAVFAINPSATEICNSIDDDCDTQVDDGLTFLNYYLDGDSDTYGAGSAVNACQSPGANYVTQNGDCNDAVFAVNPSATETCNSIDDDCDTQVDDGLTFQNYYLDGDSDGFGAGSATNACQSPGSNYVTQNGDCNDGSSAVNPSATETCNGIDDNCAGGIDDGLTFLNYFLDGDSDGFGAGSAVNACQSPGSNYVLQNGDCNDGSSAVNPSATEVCNSIDDDCDTQVDGGLTFLNYFLDGDGDGFGAGSATNACQSPGSNYVLQNGDCNDANSAVNPSATEVCNGIDDDCDNLTDSADPILVDAMPPSVTCKNHSVSLDASGSATILPGDIFQSGSDNCGTVNLVSAAPSWFGCANLGANSVTLTVNDGHGNSATCSATVTVNDVILPVASCQNVSLNLNTGGTASLTAGMVNSGSYDLCGTLNVVSVLPNSFDCNDLGANTVTLTVNDGHGNSNTCTATVTVSDNLLPTANCKAATIFLGANGTANLAAAAVNYGSSDNCGVSLSLDQASFDCGDVGANSVVLTATDPSGNSSVCSATVTVVDNLPPAANCENVSLNLDGNGLANLTTAQIDAGSSDNCGILSLNISANSFTCNDLGANTVTLTAMDVNGNTSSCNAVVTVIDDTSPTVACTGLSLALQANGYGSITSGQIFDASNSSDNCGTVSPVSVSPNLFDCGDIGANTVTLTASDGHGNTATCTTTVMVQDFITIQSVTVTPADCNGSDGSIVIVATAAGGQLRYSINNFQSFNLTGIFVGLAPGTYPIDVMAGGTTGCSASAGMVEVGTVGSTETWWKDMDGDGYSDGISEESCDSPGAGWFLENQLIATSGDCNDMNADEHPGAVWYRDMDDDNWSNGQILTQCLQPFGYKSATEVAGTTGDCDDTRNYCYPGAPEQCNNVDDDCDGQVDEGLGDLTYVGNVTFTNQTQVNNWSLCYTIIQGNLTIQNATIDSLTRLVNLRKVTGNVTIKLTGLDSLSWLMNLDTIGGTLNVNTNSQLDRLHGLDSLMQVGTDLKVYNNQQLTECCAIYELINEVNGHYLGGSTSIYSNETGCDNTAEINTDCDNNFGGGGGNNLEIGNWKIGNYGTAEEVQVALLPNPADEEVTVRWQAPSAGKTSVGGSLRVFDARGRLALSQKLEGADGELKLDVSSWKSGIYLVRTLLGGEVSAQKLIVE